uniref:Uncharacterized protein n=1 Tax=viral metagenome TaxID=1070528 RepID=A0A6H1ZS33_9ZZZZ
MNYPQTKNNLNTFELSTVIYKDDLYVEQKDTDSKLIKITIKNLSCNTCLVNIPSNVIIEYCAKHNIEMSIVKSKISEKEIKVGETISLF